MIEVLRYEAQVGWELCCEVETEAEAIEVCQAGVKMRYCMGYEGKQFGPKPEQIEEMAWISRTPN